MKCEITHIIRKWMRQRLYIWTLVGMLVLLFATLVPGMLTTRAVSGDWPTYLFDNGRSGFNGAETIINPTTAPNLKLHWSVHVGGAISTQPVEANGLIYWGSWDGFERATNLNGNQAWAVNLGQTTSCGPMTVGVASTATIATVMIGGTPTSVDFVGGGDGNFYALNALTGALIWNTLLGSPPSHFIWSSPAVYNGSVYVGMASFGDCPRVPGQLIQMDATTGSIQHIFNVVAINVSGCIGGAVWGSPTIDTGDGSVYFVTSSQSSLCPRNPNAIALVKLRASDLTKLDSWQIPKAERTSDGDFGNTPTLFQATIGGTVHNLVGVANKNGTYYALDRAALKAGPVWRAHIAVGTTDCPECGYGSISPSAWDGTTLYVAGGITTIGGVSCQGSVRALNPATGAFLWEHCLQSGPVLGAVTAVPGLVVVGQGQYMMVIDAASGQTLFRYQDSTSGSHFYGAASISNGVLYIGNQDGNLYAFGP